LMTEFNFNFQEVTEGGMDIWVNLNVYYI
jgi:hypothetical protein